MGSHTGHGGRGMGSHTGHRGRGMGSHQGQRRYMKSGGAKNGNIASAWELCWESLIGGT